VPVDVRVHISWSIHLNTVAKRRRTQKTINMSSEHRRDLSPEAVDRKKRKTGKAKEEENKKEEKKIKKEEKSLDEDILDECDTFPDSEYPTPPVLEDCCPDDHPRIENVWQDEPEDEWFCPTCNHSPCSFVQWQEELETIVDLMHPEATNKSKRYHMYKHIIRRLHGTLGKGNRKEVPVCFSQGLADLYPSEYYTGYKPNRFESGPQGDRDYDLM
jgi:hypothetical protein